ncbi:type IV-A pilus assembly ATPase PilB [Vibrio sp. V39_P1S14PM300]|uniref:type IV-A pilus assembly ATPase PilB n=1 Tax=Vibrio sp. V39_P1S14PM300 TaxID=1938690 RepID=UPI0013727287|nr:type IV-A pilus assembly ATPase PilB [Vibrio sp. V39_P1S14PM300]NAX20203.1 type IV-A pilus assembly ATPase PilB [Vibrio sp. V39_P1S14PM300]
MSGSSLAAVLSQAGLLNRKDGEALNNALHETPHAANALMALTHLDLGQLAHQIGELFALPIIELADFDYQSVCQRFALRELICRYQALPLACDAQSLILAVADPSVKEAENEFRFATGLTIEYRIARADHLLSAIRQLYGRHPSLSTSASKEVSQEELAGLEDNSAAERQETDLLREDDSPVSRFIHQVLLDAVQRQASDIHFEPYEHQYRIRLRCDGVLVDSPHSVNHLSRRLTARLKILARLDIAERRLPQDGRLKLRLSEQQAIDMRVSTLPTLWGEKVVLRILDNQATALQITSLGLNEKQQQLYLGALSKPQGLILITGPTGSGKTVSLYAGLKHINTSQVNIATAEDPVEINLPGVNQVHIDSAIGLNFATALRAFLRQDPDIIMVGEIRDSETAQIAVTAAQTGHLVLSTLHTNSAAETLTRLTNMGIAPYHLSASLSLIIAQRLVRRLCPHCKRTHALPEYWQHQLNIAHSCFSAHAPGCPHCTHGYCGRVGVYEMMPLTAPLADALIARASKHELETLAVQSGMLTLVQSAADLLRQGHTSLAELQRVLHL